VRRSWTRRPSGRRLVPPVARRPVAALVGAAALVVLVLGARYARRGAGELDQRIGAKTVAHLSGHPRVVSWLVSLGNPLSNVALVLILVAVLVLLRRPAAALLALAGPAVAAILTELVLKPLVGRRLDGGLAYPSGHTTAIFSVALVVVVALLGAASGPTLPRVIGAAAALGVAGAAGVALVVTEFHYPTDVVGGACVATVAVGGLALLLDRIPVGQASTHPAAPI